MVSSENKHLKNQKKKEEEFYKSFKKVLRLERRKLGFFSFFLQNSKLTAAVGYMLNSFVDNCKNIEQSFCICFIMVKRSVVQL